MKIAIITSRYPSENNPYNHMFVHMRSKEFISQGEQVVIYVPGSQSYEYTFEGVKVQTLPTGDIVNQLDNKTIIYLHLLNIYPFQKYNGWPIYKSIMKNSLPTVVYVHGSEVQSYSARLYEFNFRVSEVLKWIKKDFFVIPKMKKFFKAQQNKTYFVFPSLWMKNEAERNLKLAIDAYKIIPNGIETSFFRFQNQTEKRFKVLTIRSLSNKVYDIEKTIEVLDCLPEKFSLDIYGEGMYKDQYQKLIDFKKLGHRVKIIPKFLERDQMKSIFQQYGIFISTTRMDSQGVTMMEAGSAGLLIVTTDNSSKNEFIKDQVNGILGVYPNDISQKIQALTNNKNHFEEVVANGRSYMEGIDISKTVQKEVKLLKQVYLNHA